MLDKKTFDFIDKHKNEDIHKLLLSSDKSGDIDIKMAAAVIECRKRLNNKIPEWAAHKNLLFKSRVSVEQASSSTTAKYKHKYCKGGTVVDLTGGLGSDTYFFSLVNRSVIYVEKNKDLFETSMYNFNQLGADNIFGINCEITGENIGSIIDFANSVTMNSSIDMIYLDPSRRDSVGERVLSLNSYEPDISQIIDKLLEYASTVVVKLSPMVDISSLINHFDSIISIDIVSVDNDCKELLVLFQKSEDKRGISITAANFSHKKGWQEFSFNFEDEHKCTSTFAGHPLGRYLYEPNSSVYKSGAFKITGERFNLQKLSVNTHLYTSDILEEKFPGKIFKINEVVNYNKDVIRNLRKIYPKANIATRNFPLKAKELLVKLSVSEGGNQTIFGCTLNTGIKVLVVCTREI